MTVYQNLDHRRQEAERHRENSARLAHSYAQFVSVGQGQTEYPKRVPFDLTYIEMPFVSYGCVFDLDLWNEQVDDGTSEDEGPAPLPHCTGFVTQWDKDERGFYLGCWVAVMVTFPAEDGVLGMPAVDPALKPEINHHFSFAGIALKDVPPDVVD